MSDSDAHYLSSERFLLTTSTYGTPLVCTMKRYTRASSQLNNDPKAPGKILFLGHGAGFPKEIWEPTLEDLFKLDDEADKNGARRMIREAWALDCQNHGEAGVLNAEVLARNPGLLTIYDYADAFASLYRSGLLAPFDPDIHKIVLIGHSAGSVGVTLSTSHFNPPSTIPFSSLILVDPPIYSKDFEGRETEMYKLVAATTPTRRDIWASNEAAKSWMQSKFPWAMWDPRVFDVYIKYGLQPLPTPYYPDKSKGVTLTIHRTEENVAFTGARFAKDALDRLNQICDFVPVHLVFGARNDMFDREMQGSIPNPKEGRHIASVTRIKGAGHLVVQEAPTKLAATMFNILKQNFKPIATKL